jgi:G3E family GTPase
MNRNRIPLTVIGGYLGAGKTTLVNHILRHSQGQRLAVIVNDFGSINIDADLIESQDEEVINLANGCICCTLVDGFAATLTNLLNLPAPPDHVVIEASGVADPYKLGLYGHFPGFWLEGIIILADAELVRQKAGDKYVGNTVVRQLQGADLIVLNKIDLVSNEVLQSVVVWLCELVPGARVTKAKHGKVPLKLLLGHEGDGGMPSKPLRSIPDPDEHHPDVEYDTWSFTSDHPMDGEAFRAMVESLPEGVLRAKGILYLQEDPGQRHIFQLVGKRWSLKAGDAWDDEQPTSKVVMIGVSGSMDSEKFRGNTGFADDQGR